MYKNLPSMLKIALEITLLGLFLIIVLGTWVFRDNLFRTFYDPRQPFQTYEPPAPADYGQADSWLSLPDLALDTELVEGKADIFVVAPTLYLGGDGWLAPVQEPKFNAEFDSVITPNYVTPYQIAGRVFAPRYRQAALYSFLSNRDDARYAQNFAYGDVKRAFRSFLRHHRPERPIILIGHGQGGLHVQRILSEYFSGERIKNLGAAYIIDHPTPIESLPEALPICGAPDAVNCVVSFGAFTQKEDKGARHFLMRSMAFEDGSLRAANGRPVICVNPLLWTTSTDYAPDRLHLGGVAAEGLGPDTNPAPARRQAGAQCEDGILLIDKPKQRSLRRPWRFGGIYRTKPSNLFYEDLRQNMLTRTDALIATDTLPKRAPILEIDDIIDVQKSPVTLPEQ